MAELKSAFEKIGFTDVFTYIQSGNIFFKSLKNDKIVLINKIQEELSTCFKYDSKIVLLTHNQLINIINEAPKDFGVEPEKYKYDVIFLKDNITPTEIIKSIKIKDGVDTVNAGNYTLYFSRLTSKVEQSRLKYIITLPEYQNITIRNWNTTKMLFEIMNKT
jgi:uncharacterized protein (DUF1697 family)